MEKELIFNQMGHARTSYLNRTVVACVGRGGTIAWPPRSPDLTP